MAEPRASFAPAPVGREIRRMDSDFVSSAFGGRTVLTHAAALANRNAPEGFAALAEEDLA